MQTMFPKDLPFFLRIILQSLIIDQHCTDLYLKLSCTNGQLMSRILDLCRNSPEDFRLLVVSALKTF